MMVTASCKTRIPRRFTPERMSLKTRRAQEEKTMLGPVRPREVVTKITREVPVQR